MDLHAENRGLNVPTLQTARLTLRPLVPQDNTAISTALADWTVTRFLSQVPFPYMVAHADRFIAMVQADHSTPHWALDRGTGLIGVISIKPDLGYWLAPAQHGQGLMTEAAHAVVTWYFAGHTAPVIAGHFVGNVASRAILTGLGFVDTYVESITPVWSESPVFLQRMALTHERWRILRSAAK